MDRSEFLRGHFGKFQTYRGSGGLLGESYEDDLLEATAPGTGYGETIPDNQTWRCLEAGGRFYAVSTYSAPQIQRISGTFFQHVQYMEATLDNLRDGMEPGIFTAFANEAAFEAVAQGDIALGENWLQEFGKKCSPPVNMRQSLPLELQLDLDALADLACACLYRGCVKDYSGLVIFVPLIYTYRSESYLRYCRSIILRIASCVPYGLRRYLSFATNPDSNGTKNFSVLFAPEGTELDGRQVGVLLATRGGGSGKMPENSLHPDLERLIWETTRTPTILDQVYENLERGAELRSLEPKRYAQLERRLVLSREPLGWKQLREYQRQLTAPDMDVKEKEVLRQMLVSQLGSKALDAVLETAPELQNVAGIDQLMKALEAYGEVLRLLGKKLGPALSARLLQKCGASDWKLHQMNQTYRVLCGNPFGVDSERKGGGRGALSLLDDGAFASWLSDLRGLIEGKNEEIRPVFLKKVPDLVCRERECLPEAIHLLGECRESVRNECLNALAKEAVEQIKGSHLPEEEKRRCYEEICPYLEEWQQEKLRRAFESWEQIREARRAQLDSMTSFTAYLALGCEDLECEERLWEEFRRTGWKDAGLGEFLSAYEWTKHRPWPELANEPAMLSRFVRKQKMGIWLDRTTRLESLHKELLAYRYLCREEKDVWLRCEQKAEREFRVSDVLESVEYVWGLQNGEQSEESRQSMHIENALKYLAKAGVFRGCGPEVERQLPLSVTRVLGGSEKPSQAKQLDWKRIAILEGFIALVLILVLSVGLVFSLSSVKTEPAEDSAITEEDQEATDHANHEEASA